MPFGGAEHDWAALELGAWIASATGAPLKLLGAAGQTDERRDASRLLANASLLVQQFVGVAAEPVIAEPGREACIAAAARRRPARRSGCRTAGARRASARRARRSPAPAPAPILFVRRGTRAGALAPRDDVTRFTWSSPAIGGGTPIV